MKAEERMISGIGKKVEKLVARMRSLKEKNEVITNQNISYKEQLEEQKLVIQELENKLKTIKLAKSLEEGSDNDLAKAKINELVREIDKCIGYLNA